jgi:hypothetical protein
MNAFMVFLFRVSAVILLGPPIVVTLSKGDMPGAALLVIFLLVVIVAAGSSETA